ncbi:MAG: hypothetical protein R8L58_07785 [Mariprofundaceae bacterium]
MSIFPLRAAYLAALLAGIALAWTPGAMAADHQQDYLYYRDVRVPPFQKLHEFFDMPDRPGYYEVTMVSDSVGPLTFHVIRVHDDKERSELQRRSYKVGNHEFHAAFKNMTGADDLIVEVANSNPATVAKVSVFVVELRQ